MADALTQKVVISVDSDVVQKENIKVAGRRKLGVIQTAATNKENLVGRQQAILNQKLQLEGAPLAKKKTLVHQHSQTADTGPSAGPSSSVTVDDLTTTDGPSEKYWEGMAETRRRALEDSLCENELLHNRVRSLEDELNCSSQMLEHAQSLIEVLKEMLEENEAGAGGGEDKVAEEKETDADEEEQYQTPPTSAEKADGPERERHEDE